RFCRPNSCCRATLYRLWGRSHRLDRELNLLPPSTGSIRVLRSRKFGTTRNPTPAFVPPRPLTNRPRRNPPWQFRRYLRPAPAPRSTLPPLPDRARITKPSYRVLPHPRQAAKTRSDSPPEWEYTRALQ